MISRFKAWSVSLLVLLAMIVVVGRLGAATYTVDLSNSNFNPNKISLLVGDTISFHIVDDYHYIDLDGQPLFGGANLGRNTPGLTYTFNTDGTFELTDPHLHAPPYFYLNCIVTVVQPVNAAPTVAMLNLTNHMAIMVTNSLTNLTLRADAQDEDGSIRRVQFYFGSYTNSFNVTNLIGTITNSSTNNTTFSYTWTNVPPGHYQVQARAYDNLEVYANTLKLNLSLYTPFTNTLPYITNTTSVAFRFNTDTGLVYVIEVSTNLTNWASISTNTATNSFIEVVDPNLTTLTQRMYRIRLLP